MMMILAYLYLLFYCLFLYLFVFEKKKDENHGREENENNDSESENKEKEREREAEKDEKSSLTVVNEVGESRKKDGGEGSEKKKKKKKESLTLVIDEDASQKKDGGEGSEKKKKEKEEKGPSTIIMKVDIHCDGCASEISRCVRYFEGVQTVKTDVASNKITVVGALDPFEIRDKLQEKTRKQVDLISHQVNKDEGNDPEPNNGTNAKKRKEVCPSTESS